MFLPSGLELETPSLVPVKKNASAVVVSDKYNLKPIPLKRQRYGPRTGFCVGYVCGHEGGRGGKLGCIRDHVDGSSSNSTTVAPGDGAPPVEKKYKPLNTTPNATKEIKVKIIPPQRESKVEEHTELGENSMEMCVCVWGGVQDGFLSFVCLS